MTRIICTLLVAGLAVACAATPTVTKRKTTMTIAEIKAAGLECRRNVPITSIIARHICASPAAWERYDKAALYETELHFGLVRSLPNR